MRLIYALMIQHQLKLTDYFKRHFFQGRYEMSFMFKYIFHNIGLIVSRVEELCPLLLTLQNSYTYGGDTIWIEVSVNFTRI